MNYENANRRFMQYYRPLRDVQRRYPQLVKPALVYGAVTGFNYMRNRFNRFRNSLYGRAVTGAVSSLKKKEMPPAKKKLKKMNPPSPLVKDSKGNKYEVVRTVKGGHQEIKPLKKSSSTQTSKATKSKPVVVNQSSVGKRIVAKSRITKKKKKFSILGTEYRTETSGKKLATEVAYIGHATMPKKVMLKLLFSSVFKKLFEMVGNLTSDLTQPLPFVVNTDTIRYQERTDVNAGWANANFTLATTGTNIKAIIDYFVDLFGNNNNSSQIQIANFQFIPTAGSVLKYTRLTVLNSHIKIKTYSNFTVQNQSIPEATATESDNVQNVVLRGKCYQGSGSGSLIGSDDPTATTPPSYASETGVIDIGTTTNVLNELPPGYAFVDAKKEGSFMIDPGEYKQSVLRDNFSISFNKLLRYATSSVTTGNNNYTPSLLGKFKIIGFEKMIDEVTPEIPGIIVAWEHQFNISCYLKPGLQMLSMPIVQS